MDVLTAARNSRFVGGFCSDILGDDRSAAGAKQMAVAIGGYVGAGVAATALESLESDRSAVSRRQIAIARSLTGTELLIVDAPAIPPHKDADRAVARSTRQSLYWTLQGELATQGDDNFLVGEAQSPGTGHEVRRHPTEQMPPVRGGCSSGRGDAGATAAAGGEHSLLL